MNVPFFRAIRESPLHYLFIYASFSSAGEQFQPILKTECLNKGGGTKAENPSMLIENKVVIVTRYYKRLLS